MRRIVNSLPATVPFFLQFCPVRPFFSAVLTVWMMPLNIDASPRYASVVQRIVNKAIERRDHPFYDRASTLGKALYCVVAMVGIGLLFYCASE